MTQSYLLRVEAVNLGSFVYDTGDLSTTRGGSLLLLKGIREVATKFSTELDPLSTGASIGLFAVRNGADAKTVATGVKNFLTADSPFKHATWVVDVVEEDSRGFIAARERLIALNRWQQMQQPSLVIPPWNSDSKCLTPCSVDRRRPATARDTARGEQVSPSVLVRREFGRDQKQEFFKEWAPTSAAKMTFVNDLDSLSADPSRGNLHHKIAVLFIDGNGFGKIQDDLIRQAATPAQQQKDWDKRIKTFHGQFLEALLDKMKATPNDWTNGDNYRIEVLLWGGDDILLVVPAWQGWWTLGFFFQEAAKWTINTNPLTHKAGLIFCHHKAPIQRIVRLADELAATAKLDGTKNRAAYHVFESFDHAGGRLDHVRRYLVPSGASTTDGLVVDGEAMLSAQAAFETVKPLIPRRRLAMLAQALRTGDQRADRLREELEAILNTQPGARQGLEACFGTGESGFLWIHVAELWDYLA